MVIVEKICQRLADPLFYRKRGREFFRRFRAYRDRPVELETDRFERGRAVVVVAHPDDETFCSGLIRRLAASGSRVTVLCLTRGEGGPTGDVPRERLGSVREQEMRDSCGSLGVAEVGFLDHIDPMAGRYRVYAPGVSVGELADQLAGELEGARLVISHGSDGEYWHPAHLLVHAATRKALGRMEGTTEWLTFMARQPGHAMPRLVNWDDEADYVIDVTAEASAREAALACHRSQLALFGRFAGGDYRDFIAQTGRETYHRVEV